MLNRTNRALLVTGLILLALMLMRLGQQAMVDPPGFALPAFEHDQVQLLSVCTPERCAAFARRDGHWAFADSGDSTPVDQARIAELLAAWSEGHRTRYKVAADVTGAPDPMFGTMTQSTLALRFERAPDDEIVSLEIGEAGPDGARYVMREGDRAIYVLDVPRMDLLRTDAAAWTDRDAMKSAARSLDAFGILNSVGRLEFARDGEAWAATEPAELSADPRAVSRLLDEVALLPTLTELTLDASIAARAEGLDRPRLSVWTRRGEVTTRWHFAGDDPDGRGVLVDREGGDETLQVADGVVLTRFDVGPEQLQDLTLLRFALDARHTLRWTRGDRSATFESDSASIPEVALALSLLAPLRAVPGEAVTGGGAVGVLTLTGPDGEVAVEVFADHDGATPVAVGGRTARVSARLVERLDALLD